MIREKGKTCESPLDRKEVCLRSRLPLVSQVWRYRDETEAFRRVAIFEGGVFVRPPCQPPPALAPRYHRRKTCEPGYPAGILGASARGQAQADEEQGPACWGVRAEAGKMQNVESQVESAKESTR